MNLIQCITAYTAIERIGAQPHSYEFAHKLMLLRRRLAPHREFFAQHEYELVRKYAVLDETGAPVLEGGNLFNLRDPADHVAFDRERMALNSVEVEDSFDDVRLKIPKDVRLTLAEIEALAPFIEEEG